MPEVTGSLHPNLPAFLLAIADIAPARPQTMDAPVAKSGLRLLQITAVLGSNPLSL